MTSNQIAFSVTPTKIGPALVLVHALGADQRMWRACIELLQERFTVVSIDLRGAGESGIPPRPWTLEDHADDIDAVRASLGLSRIVVIGCAVGSLISVVYARKYPQHAAGLVLSEPTDKIGIETRETVRERASAVRTRGMQSLVPAAIDLAFEGLPHDRQYAEYTQMFLSQPPEGYAQLAESIVGCDLSESLQRLPMPALVVVGEHDRLFPPETARRVHERLPNSELVVMQRCAHFPPFQKPKEFSSHVESFVQSGRLTDDSAESRQD